MAKKAFVRAKLESLTVDRHQYKPYVTSLLPTNVYVEIEVPVDDVVDTFEVDGSNAMVLNLHGFTAVLSEVANVIDTMHDEYINKARKAGKVIV